MLRNMTYSESSSVQTSWYDHTELDGRACTLLGYAGANAKHRTISTGPAKTETPLSNSRQDLSHSKCSVAAQVYTLP